ncbi:MAG TPA: hypothetical protein VF869_05515 [Jatrophihabitantaceae bacterium]
MTSAMTVYHFTDTARLPWILTAGELRPGRNRVGGFPSPDFLWATTDERGDRTSALSRQGLRRGMVRAVRFTLAAEDFEPWPQAHTRFPQWTPDQVARLERLVREQGVSPLCWRCRVDSLAANRWLKIETRTYTTPWTAFDHGDITCLEAADNDGTEWVRTTVPPDDQTICGVVVAGKLYASQLIVLPNGAHAYRAAEPREVA